MLFQNIYVSVDIMTSFGPMCVVTSAIARFIPIFKLAYFWNEKTYTGEILIWRHIDGVLSEKPQKTHNLNSLFSMVALVENSKIAGMTDKLFARSVATKIKNYELWFKREYVI